MITGLLKDFAAPDKPVRFSSRTGVLELSAAEIESVRRALLGPDAKSADLASLLRAETLALRLKVSEDIRDHETAAGLDAELERAIADCLRHDLALANSLAADYRIIIDQLFVADDRAAANRLGELRIAVRQDMARIRQLLLMQADQTEASIGPAAVSSRPKEAVEGIDLDRLLADEAAAEEQPEGLTDPVTSSRRRLHELRERKRQHERMLRQRKVMRMALLILATAAVVSLGAMVMLVVSSLETPDAVVLTLGDFAAIRAIIDVEATPPSMLVRVNGLKWQELGEKERKAIVEQVRDIASRVAYNGVQLRNEKGDLVGEWIRGIGIFIPPPPEGYPTPTPVPTRIDSGLAYPDDTDPDFTDPDFTDPDFADPDFAEPPAEDPEDEFEPPPDS